VARFHKTEWTVFDTVSSIPERMPSNFTWDLCVDGENGVWVGTDEGLIHIVYHEEDSYEVRLVEGTEGSDITAVRRLFDGRIWFGTRMGEILELADGKPKTIRDGQTEGGWDVKEIIESRTGAIWAAVNRAGIIRFQGDEGKLFTLEQFAFGRADCLFEDQSGRIWIAGSGKPLYFENGEWHIRPCGVADVKFLQQGLGPEGKFFAGSGTGLQIIGQGSKTERIPYHSSFGIPQVRVIRFENEDLAWVGTKEGIFKMEGPRWRFSGYSRVDDENVHYSAFHAAPPDQPLVAVDSEKRLLQYDIEGNVWDHLLGIPNSDTKLVKPQAISATVNGILWIGDEKAVYKIDRNRKLLLEQISHPINSKNFRLYHDIDNDLYIYGDSGVYKRVEGDWVSVFSQSEKPQQIVRDLERIGNDRFIVCLNTQIQIWDHNKQVQVLENNLVREDPIHFC
jgi:ligand-binding sensor domain-containing protein